MPRSVYRLLTISLCTLACVAAAAVSWGPPGGDLRTEDHNRDGRPDVWRVYDRQGQLAKMAVDTNFDGRSDVDEYYESGALVRRESDRDFNDRIDLVQEFDATTREHVRSVVDKDFDGTADLLILFQDGQPVFSKWAHPATPAVALSDPVPDAGGSRRTADDQLALLMIRSTDLAVRAARRRPARRVGLRPLVGCRRPAVTSSALASSSHFASSNLPHPSSGLLFRHCRARSSRRVCSRSGLYPLKRTT